MQMWIALIDFSTTIQQCWADDYVHGEWLLVRAVVSDFINQPWVMSLLQAFSWCSVTLHYNKHIHILHALQLRQLLITCTDSIAMPVHSHPLPVTDTRSPSSNCKSHDQESAHDCLFSALQHEFPEDKGSPRPLSEIQWWNPFKGSPPCHQFQAVEAGIVFV